MAEFNNDCNKKQKTVTFVVDFCGRYRYDVHIKGVLLVRPGINQHVIDCGSSLLMLAFLLS